jgi:hypothetical protein
VKRGADLSSAEASRKRNTGVANVIDVFPGFASNFAIQSLRAHVYLYEDARFVAVSSMLGSIKALFRVIKALLRLYSSIQDARCIAVFLLGLG